MGTFIVLAIVILGARPGRPRHVERSQGRQALRRLPRPLRKRLSLPRPSHRLNIYRPSRFGKGGFFFLLKRMIGHENKPYGSLPCTSPQ